MQFRRFIFLISKLPCPSKISFHSYKATCVKVQQGVLAYSQLLCSGSPHATELPQLRADGPTSNVSFPHHLLLINWNIVSAHHNFLGHFPHVSIFPFSGTLNANTYKPILPGSGSFLIVITAENILFPEKPQCVSSAPWAWHAGASQTPGALPRTRAHPNKTGVVPKQYVPLFTEKRMLSEGHCHSHTWEAKRHTVYLSPILGILCDPVCAAFPHCSEFS